MSDKVTLEDLARAEAASLRERERTRASYAELQRRVVRELPEHFLALARGVREGVRRFNEAVTREAQPGQRGVHYEESAAVTTRSANLQETFFFTLERKPHRAEIYLRSLWRPHLPDALVIEGGGVVGIPDKEERFTLRIDALPDPPASVRYRVVVSGQEVATPLEELPERLVKVVVTGQVGLLSQR